MNDYYYLNGNNKVGPFSLDSLKGQPITPATLVWNSTLPDWVEAGSLAELKDFFVSAAASAPAPPTPVQQVPYNAGGNTYNNNYGNSGQPPMPDNYLVWAILTTVLCCLPLGIVSIINSSKVSSLYAIGDYAGAQSASESAKKWAIWSAIIGPILYIIFVIIYVVVIAAAVGAGAFSGL
ncbi:MAG: CD225/dispanin family protein [Tannerella sp.]|jgi:hypothetical protein|nr:CD225/dispanin family protein [Tannerella sp.]